MIYKSYSYGLNIIGLFWPFFKNPTKARGGKNLFFAGPDVIFFFWVPTGKKFHSIIKLRFQKKMCQKNHWGFFFSRGSGLTTRTFFHPHHNCSYQFINSLCEIQRMFIYCYIFHFLVIKFAKFINILLIENISSFNNQ